MPSPTAPRIAVGPAGAPDWMVEAVQAGGGHVVALEQAEGLVWADPAGPGGLHDALGSAPDLRWVQLPWAGIESYLKVLDDERVWTCAKGVYADPVAEHALALALAGLRGLGTYTRATSWGRGQGLNLLDARVTVVGGGGITESLLRLLVPFRAHVTVVRNRVNPMEGADVVLGVEHLHDALLGADLVVLALALTSDTEGLIGADELRIMERHAWLVNVARGRHVVTDALVDALRDGEIGGAALDVTDPEPLPEGHPLWSLANCIVTPHTGNTAEMARPLLAERITANVRRFAAGEPLLGEVDADLGY